MSNDVETRVKQIIATQALLEPSDISDDSLLDELGLDSLGLVETIFAIEESFGISVPFNANTPETGKFDIRSVGAVVEGVKRLLDEQD